MSENCRLRLEILKTVDWIKKLERRNENTTRSVAEKQLARTTPNALDNTENGPNIGNAKDYRNGLSIEQENSARNASIRQENPQKMKLNRAQITKLQRLVQASIPSTLLEKIRRSQSALDQQQIGVEMESRPTAAYFRNGCRGPIGVLCKALSK